MIGTDPTRDVKHNARELLEVSVRAWHPHEDPIAVSQAIQLMPSYVYRAGDQRVTPSGRALNSVHKETLWSLNIGLNEGSSLADAIAALSGLVASRARELGLLRKRGWRFECYVGLFLNSNRTETLSEQQMAFLSSIGFGLVLNIYPPNADKPD